jgi:hypothetical protein
MEAKFIYRSLLQTTDRQDLILGLDARCRAKGAAARSLSKILT